MNSYRQSSIENNLWLRARTIHYVRTFFIDNNYLEIETPYRISAPAPEAQIDAVTSGNRFLHTSPELCMKQLLAAGYHRIFQICRCFRQQERGAKHLPEFTILEWYRVNTDYFDMMEQCEDLIRFLADKLDSGGLLVYQGAKIDLKKPWQRMSVSDAFNRFASISMEKALVQDLFDEVMALEIEPNLGYKKPLFLYDYPAEKAALAALKSDNKALAQRFELYICGLELCNAFTELTDSDEQRLRFKKEQDVRRSSGKQIYPTPEKFLKTLNDMPDASGNALGIDRLVMLFADSTKIDDVVAFTPEEL